MAGAHDWVMEWAMRGWDWAWGALGKAQALGVQAQAVKGSSWVGIMWDGLARGYRGVGMP